MKLCLPVALCGNGSYEAEGGGGAIVQYWIWKIVRPYEKILATPLHVHVAAKRPVRLWTTTS